jgi:IS5 family transposase
MSKQIALVQAAYDAKRKTTRRDRFLAEMEIVVPWAGRLEQLRPHDYPAAGKGPGRPPLSLERMLQLYFLQQWFGLADEALEDAIYDSQAFRGFLGLDLGREAVPDATTLLKFRHRLETTGLTKTLFDTINALWRERGLLMNQGTLVGLPPSSRHRPRPSTRRGHAIPTGITPARASSFTLAPRPTSGSMRNPGGCTAPPPWPSTWRISPRRATCCMVRRKPYVPMPAIPVG